MCCKVIQQDSREAGAEGGLARLGCPEQRLGAVLATGSGVLTLATDGCASPQPRNRIPLPWTQNRHGGLRWPLCPTVPDPSWCAVDTRHHQASGATKESKSAPRNKLKASLSPQAASP